ncbi:hypothetical protein GCM10017083_17640 [Thalassobaculum fulvum]|uniref:PAS domain-containing protein n=1 Tax=Thalassobaculum fulvum TaxID=1633335 RepID=A0A918XRN6_9PROT|nr:hypothetical protein [Thalassobaculum fulvum]GHD47347.1 hypothetical protein GCM10017083_17640 [Thalassobaculum fulvum]
MVVDLAIPETISRVLSGVTDTHTSPNARLPSGLVHPVHPELFRLPYQSEMWSIWQSARADDAYPPDRCIDPTLLPPAALPFIVLYEIGERPDVIKIRLEGSEIVRILGRSRRGGIVGQQSGTQAHLGRLTWAAANGKPYWVKTAIEHDRYHYRTYTVLVLPYGQNGRVTRLVGVNAFDNLPAE